MKTSRLEAFSDGVMAIIITIMVLEIEIPEGANFYDLHHLFPVFVAYLISFIYVGIYWNNHHHLLNITEKVNGSVLWANLHLLFWLSLLPFATGWLGENHIETAPVTIYGAILFMCALAWKILTTRIIKSEGKDSKLAEVYENDKKQFLALILYAVGIGCSYFIIPISLGLYVLVAALWFIPDKRIERIED